MSYCSHKNLRPIVYTFMNRDIIDKIYQNVVIYGGAIKNVDSPDWFCLDCLEELYDKEIDYLN